MMNQFTLLFGILSITLLCCKQPESKVEKESTPDFSVLIKEFERELTKTVQELNAKGADSIILPIVRDTIYFFTVNNSNIYSVLGQYRTSGNKMKLGIIGIGNIKNESPPTFTLLDTSAEQFIGDSSYTSGDSLVIFGRIKRNTGTEQIKIGFDLKFDGSSFPWSTN